MYEYKANILKVVDGDTVHAQIDLGLDVTHYMVLRLAGINAPELSNKPAGQESKAYLAHKLLEAPVFVDGFPRITIRTLKDKREKYGRYLAYLFTGSLPNAAYGEEDWAGSLNEALVEAGHAVWQTY